ncbi:alpha/beta hydrolase [Kiritimatiellota bacterium B12222]|nr:alpha/beta hydrolase [Kiritimatiellota bacterium B12222]
MKSHSMVKQLHFAKTPFFLTLFIGLLCASFAKAENDLISPQVDLSYLEEEVPADDYAKAQCTFDLYLPQDTEKPFPLLVWFHGGALKGGSKSSGLTTKLAQSFASQGVGVMVADYRLNPKVTFPTYLEDAANAVRWAVNHTEELNAHKKVFVGGHSAGGYITSMLAMDRRYLKQAGVNIENIGGYLPMSGQTMTHFTVAEERGLSSKMITADDAAPIHYLKKDMPPIFIIIGGDDWPARVEENLYFVAAMEKVAENENISMLIVPDRDHSDILRQASVKGDPAGQAMLKFMSDGILPRP